MKALLFLIAVLATTAAQAQTLLRVGWCGPVITTAAAPFAIAEKLGWFADDGFKVELVPLPGSSDCVKQLATGELPYVFPSPEAVALMRQQGVKMKTFYTAYQSNIYGIAVPSESPIQTIADLKGKTIGVTSMASGGVIIARALTADAGLNPDTDIHIVVGGEGGQTAALLRSNQLDALSQFDTAYALVENAGIRLRMLKDNNRIAHFPSNGLVAMEKTLTERKAEAVSLARNLAMGTVFMQANPEAAVRIMFELYPQTKPIGKDDDEALADGLRPLQARLHAWDLASSGATQFGQSILANYDAYFAFLQKYGILTQTIPASDVTTDEIIADANDFDVEAVRKRASGYKVR